MENKTIILGEEYNDDLIANLKNLLREEGAHFINESWGVGGSQDYQRYEVDIKNSILQIEMETYIGISITGESPLVDYIYQRLKNGNSGKDSVPN